MVTFHGGNSLGIPERECTRNPNILHPAPHQAQAVCLWSSFRLGVCTWPERARIRYTWQQSCTVLYPHTETVPFGGSLTRVSIALSQQLPAALCSLRTFSLFLLPSTVRLGKVEVCQPGREVGNRSLCNFCSHRGENKTCQLVVSLVKTLS